MKKLYALLLCVLLVAVLAVTAFATETAKITVTPENSTVYPGDEVTVTVSVTSEKMWSSMGYFPWYNSPAFEVISGEVLKPFYTNQLSEFDAVGGNGGFTYNTSDFSSGDVFRFTIKIRDDAPLGEYTVSDVANMNIASELVDAKIVVACRHEYGKWTVTGNEHARTCNKCDDIQMADHVWDAGKVTTEPTCKDKGVKTYTCTDCSATKTEDIAKTNDHAYGKWTEAEIEHTKTCSVCGDVQKAAHAWDTGKITTEPTCKDEGVKTYTCADCGVSKIEPVAKTDDHAYGACTKVSEEEHTHTCGVCGKEELLPHDYAEGRCVDCGAYQFWRYIIEEGKVIITKYVGPGGEVEILEKIEELDVIAIAEGAFEGCADITGISIPKTVKRIAKAFAGCDSLKKVNITDMDAWMAMEFADAECNPLKTAGSLYLNGELVTEVKISGTVGNHVFTGCTELKSVIIAEDVEGIGEGTFDGCAGISNVYCQGDSQQMENLGIKENENLAAADVYCDVGKGEAGNLDGNEEVSDGDALYLLRFTLFPERYPVQAPPDMNNDGAADDSDALYLLRYTLFADRYPLYPGSMLSELYNKD